MRVFNSNTLLEFAKEHAEAALSVRELNRTLRGAAWTKMQDVLDGYPSATVLNAERVVFKVKGNDYRAIVAFDFERRADVGVHRRESRARRATQSATAGQSRRRVPLAWAQTVDAGTAPC